MNSSSQNQSSKLFTICICTYGDYPTLLGRCLNSILQEPRIFEYADIIVGANAASEKSFKAIEARVPPGREITIIRSKENLNKSGMRRIMISLVETPYIVSVDDDVSLKPGWLRYLKAHVEKNNYAIDASGFTLTTTPGSESESKVRSMPYSLLPWRKPWWRWRRPEGPHKVRFPGGGFHLMRTEFVREHDFPDFTMLIDHDDILLGDLVLQMEGVYVSFPQEVTDRIIIDHTSSRGDHWKG